MKPTNNTAELISEALSWERIYQHYHVKYQKGKNSLCPFHEDKTPSLSFDEDKGLFHCFGCEAKGNYYHFIGKKENLDTKSDFPKILKIAESIAGTCYLEKTSSKKNPPAKKNSSPPENPKLDPQEVQKHSTQLQGAKQVVEWFAQERGIEPETLKRAHVGFDAHKQMKGKAVIHFPYQNRDGEFYFNRIRAIGSGQNVMSEKGSKAMFYLRPNLEKAQHLFVAEGEIDALTIFQHSDEVVGLPGARSFKSCEKNNLGHLQSITFCGDNDGSGRSFNEEAIVHIKEKYPWIKTYYLDWEGSAEKYDVNDFYKSLENKDELIQELIKKRIEVDYQKITPLQFFSRDFACTVVFEEKIEGGEGEDKKLVKRPYLITSNHERIALKAEPLAKKLLFIQRKPLPHDYWRISSVAQFLRGSNTTLKLAETFESIELELKKYMTFEDERLYQFVPLWIIGTYFHRGMLSFPYLSLNGSKSCGKSKLMSFIAGLSFQGRVNVGGTAASTIRLINSNHITCCVDEAENLSNSKDENSQALLGIYNSGYKEGAEVSKCGVQNKVEFFDPYCPKVFAGINALNDTTASRCILINMPPVKNRQKFNQELDVRDEIFLNLRDQLHVHMLSDFKTVLSLYRKLQSPSENLSGRDWEIWKPIICIASVISTDLNQKMTNLAIDLTQKRKSTDLSSKDDLDFLLIVKKLLDSAPELSGYVVVSSIKEALLDSQIDTFIELADEHSSNRWIGDWLKRLGIIKERAKTKKVDGFNHRCYKILTNTLDQRLEALQK